MTDRQSRMPDRISPGQVLECEGVEDWPVSGDGACAYLRTGSFVAGARLVEAISQMAGVEDHKPDLDLRHDGVTVRLITYTHDYYEPGRLPPR
jgi:4a-hydroxytetrahydrobiopterin dehydratase